MYMLNQHGSKLNIEQTRKRDMHVWSKYYGNFLLFRIEHMTRSIDHYADTAVFVYHINEYILFNDCAISRYCVNKNKD